MVDSSSYPLIDVIESIVNVFTVAASIYANLVLTEESFYIRKEFNFYRIGFGTHAVSLLWNTYRAAVTSCEKRSIIGGLPVQFVEKKTKCKWYHVLN